MKKYIYILQMIFTVSILLSFFSMAQAKEKAKPKPKKTTASQAKAKDTQSKDPMAKETKNSQTKPIETAAPTAVAPVAKEAVRKSKEELPPSKFKPGQQFNFPPTKNGVTVSLPQFVYDLKSNPSTLSIGDFQLSSEEFMFAFGNFVKFDDKLAKAMGRSNVPILILKWPKSLIKVGELELLDRSGDVLWSYSIDQDEVDDWQDQLSTFAGKYSEGEKNKKAAKSLFWNSSLGFLDINLNDALASKNKAIVKFCFKQSEDTYFTRLCSSNYQAVVSKGNLVNLKPAKSGGDPRILIRNEVAPLEGALTLKPGEKFEFLADLANGMTYEFQSVPNLVKLIDFVDDSATQKVILRGRSEPPVDSLVLGKVDRTGFLYKVKWLPTIGDFGPYWEIHLSRDKAYLDIPGQGGGLFRQNLAFASVPTESERPKFNSQNISSTYVDFPMVAGSVLKGNKVSSKEQKIASQGKSGEFKWDFSAPNTNDYNDATFEVSSKASKWSVSHTIYRGNPREISGRFTGVLSAAGESVLLGELAYNQWFESFFGWKNYYLGQQRWGLSVKAFQSLASFKQQNSDEKITFSNATYDLKYRLNPGIWGRDETWGLLAGGQSVSIQGISAPMMGAGFFWARSFPKVFDDIMNIVPLMRYPKWTDMEFVFYPTSADSNITMGMNYSINFHGKIMWSQSIFGELGFGMKAYDFESASDAKQIIFQSFYGTAGLGINF